MHLFAKEKKMLQNLFCNYWEFQTKLFGKRLGHQCTQRNGLCNYHSSTTTSQLGTSWKGFNMNINEEGGICGNEIVWHIWGIFLTSFQTYFSLHKYLRVGSDRICSTIVLGMPLQKLWYVLNECLRRGRANGAFSMYTFKHHLIITDQNDLLPCQFPLFFLVSPPSLWFD